AACKQRNELNPGMNAWLEETSADIVLMQEVRANPAQTELALKPSLEAGWHLAMADALTPGAKGRAGVGILSRTPLTDVEIGFGSFLESGRWIEATAAGVRVASLYLPSGDVNSPKLDEKYNFLDEFARVLEKRAAEHTDMVIGGDWNSCHRAQDLHNTKPNEKTPGHVLGERAFLDDVVGAFAGARGQERKGRGGWLGIVDYETQTRWQPTEDPKWFDVARRLEPEAEGPYTWWTYRGQAFNNDAGWRIDYQAATDSMLQRAQRSWVEKAPSVEERWSDHSPLMVEYN